MRAADRAQVSAWKRELWGGEGGDDQRETVLVWESDDGVLGGFVSLSLRPWAEGCQGEPVPYVEGWYVTEARRRQGIGRALIEAAERWARSQGFTEIGSDALLDNAVSLRAHRRLGFVPTERLQFFRKDLEPAPAGGGIRIALHEGPRDGLRELFELAEDSPAQLDAYLDLGRVLVATEGRAVAGHLQLVDAPGTGRCEIKNMAVRTSHQGRGIGRMLVRAAIDLVAAESCTTLLVATAAADAGNLRFYQRLGFRMASIDRDAFTQTAGYPPGIRIDGIELRDRVWLSMSPTPGG